ncbi:MAG: hypothetical protein A2Y62_11510 [Candidatus Fischerbacteria bacterium RBG_13_37_8]|uniref:CRISPR-associated protein Csx11 n=1 Tax=Candidatus Fischerbacteria bacterium RBG_13_37_8 TaxID=1817863 RepID=A0A1F5VY81_9BACT|nr:MAG: hypothetical protein A2Y62_11510 [Candidatus Fischerbacteria bacterium RBG_13_37_8]
MGGRIVSSLLGKLEKNRTPILLAEIGAYLHDLGKARKQFIDCFAKESSSCRDDHNFPSSFPDDLRIKLKEIRVKICNEEVSLFDFIEKHHDRKENGTRFKDCEIPPQIRLLYADWNGYDGMDSGMDKGVVSSNSKQSKDYTFIATTFGYEPKENKIEDVTNLTKELYNLVKDKLSDYKNNKIDIKQLRSNIIKDTKKHYLKFLGETRRPANDVTLWDHSYSVATLFKCAVAKNILDCSNSSFDPLDFSWKILSADFNALSILGKGIKIGDILGYKKKIEDAFDKVKEIVEEEYPLGNEIYRDNSGIYLLIPDIEIKELKELTISRLIEIEPELMPEITVKEIFNLQSSNYKFDCKNQPQIPGDIKGQRRNFENDKKRSLLKILPEAREITLQEVSYPSSSERFFSEKFMDDWSDKEVCPICRLRPMKENSEGCKHCLDRRVRRAKNWIKDYPKQTIWLDEVSDHNDRIVLLTGCFVLDNWLDGSLIRTMAIKNNALTSKNPSPARIRRCWETTQEFIKSTIFANILSNFTYGKESLNLELRNKRIQFKLDQKPKIMEGATCDVDLKGIRLSPACIDKNSGTFISTINLQILEKWGYIVGGQKGRILDAKPADEKFQEYLPYVQIYDSPDQFMAIVPAYDALDIAAKIVEEYEIQFSKVRDRLPFHIGIIAFHRRIPLYVAMDAGKKLIDAFKKSKEIEASVVSPPQEIDTNIDTAYKKFGHKVIKLKLITNPSYSSVPLEWVVSCSTGDPVQDDEWHPYLRYSGRNSNRGNYSFDYGNGNYVVHVKKLQLNDCIKIEGSYFKLAYLENAAERFKVDEKLRSLGDVKRLDELWNDVACILKSKNLGISQMYAFWHEVMKRYEDYKGDSVWQDFVKSSLMNKLRLCPEKDKELFDKLFQATKDCLLDLCLNWNLKVRKLKP